MEITSTSAAGSISRQPAAQENPALNSDFETFLRMLTVQMQNQDPLNPIESSDFAVQLATFSGVEQQVKTNDLLTDLTGALGATAISDVSIWIGKEARTAAPAFFGGDPITVETTVIPGADSAELVVRDPSGFAIDRRPIPTSGGPVIWNGFSASGNRFLEGTYAFSVESVRDGSVIEVTEGETFAQVVEARFADSGAIELVLEGGGIASPQDVRGLRLVE